MRLLLGNFKGPEGKQGPEGQKGNTGDTGQRGSRCTSGTNVTGTSTTGTIFASTGITDSLLHDYYINTSTGNLYECTVPGPADVAEWTYICNIKGPTGATGPAGSISDINNQKPTYTVADRLENIESGETVKTAFGKLKKALSLLITHYTQQATATVLGHVKLSNSAAVTQTGLMALDAIEKNASVTGTLANQISQVNSKLATAWADATTTDNVVDGAVQWHQWGLMCEIIVAVSISTPEAWKELKIATNLPPSRFGIGARGIIQSQETGLAYCIKVTSNGELFVRTDAHPQSGWYRGAITYITTG